MATVIDDDSPIKMGDQGRDGAGKPLGAKASLGTPIRSALDKESVT
jgi:hypothetical protein